MALLTILHHPDPRLRHKAKPVERFDAELQRLIDDMFETMYDAPGVGLAATQVGVPCAWRSWTARARRGCASRW